MVMQALGGLGLNFLGNMANQMMSYRSNKKLQENQAKLNYQYAEKSARNQPTWNRAGLESAGYNPMLAVQNATAGANSSWTGSAHADSMDTHAGTDMIANAQSFQRLNNETKTAESTSKLNSANARKAIAESVAQELRNPYIPQQEQSALNKMSAETLKLSRETSYMDALEDNMKQQIRLGEMGLSVQKYGYDTAYNASTYGANKAFEGAKYGVDMYDKHLPSGRSESFKNYMFGSGAGIGALGGVAGYARGLFRPHVGF